MGSMADCGTRVVSNHGDNGVKVIQVESKEHKSQDGSLLRSQQAEMTHPTSVPILVAMRRL